MSDLRALFERYGTDKADSGYDVSYRALFDHRRDTVRAVLEIGIGTLDPTAHSSMVGYAAPHYTPGGSLRAWRDYFPRAIVYGIDVQPDTQFVEERITTTLADSTDARQLDAALGDLRFDLIVDDGDHHPDSQVRTLHHLWPRVVPGGVYVVEDVIGEPEIHRLVRAATGLPGTLTATVGPTGRLLVITCSPT